MKHWLNTVVMTLLLTLCMQLHAGIIIGGTRLIYDGSKKESSLSIGNPDKVPYLIQSWVDSQEGDTSKAPFIITPPLFRLDGDQNNILRVVRAGGNLPNDKESLYWLNIKSIPSAEKKDNTLQIAVKTRIKLIYRPKGLSESLYEAAERLKWNYTGDAIQVTNSSPYYITFFKVKVNGTPLQKTTMVAPQSSSLFELPAGSQGGPVSWEIINDYGSTSKPFTKDL